MSREKAEARKPFLEEADPAAPLEGIVGYKLKRAQIKTFQELTERFAELELRPAQFALLRVLEASPGLSQSDAALMLDIRSANFVGLMDNFEARGIAKRVTSPADRRERRLFLTAAGKALARKASTIFADYERELADRLGGTEPRDRFLDMLDRIIGGG